MIGQSRHICIRDLIMICKNTILELVVVKVALKLSNEHVKRQCINL